MLVKQLLPWTPSVSLLAANGLTTKSVTAFTVCDGERANQDIFVHHSAVKVNEEQYRYLVQGEYVEFTCVKTDSGEHEYQATEVTVYEVVNLCVKRTLR